MKNKLFAVFALAILLVLGCKSPVNTDDIVPPTVSATCPVDAGTEVAISGNAFAFFSEDMELSTINDETFTLKQGATAIPGTVTYTDKIALFNPIGNLTYNTVYTATINTGAMDLAGNALAFDKVWTFSTTAVPDCTPPLVTATSPIDLATAVAAGVNVTATFNEEMNPATISAESFTLMQGTTPVAGVVSYAGNIGMFNPDSDLAYSTEYTATISTAAADISGNALEIEYVWTFTTDEAPDLTAPAVSTTSPADLAASVAIGANVTATFSEAMAAASLGAASFTLKQGETAIPGSVTYADNVAVFNPNSALAYNTVYTATVTTAATDLAGNGLATNKVWTFTTAQETTPPTIISTSPIDLASSVAIGVNVSATFSEAMAAATIDATSFTLKQGATAVAGVVSYASGVALFNPASDLANNTVYTATVSTAATDLAGNALVANEVWTFTTVQESTPPTVIATNPADLATSVPIGSDVSASFSEAMAAGTINASTFTLKQGATTVPGAVSYAGTVATFNPTASLAFNTVYTATIGSGATDLAGNALAANKVWTFTTVQESTPPTVISTSPADLATSVAIASNVSASFSEAMLASTINGTSFTLKQGATSIPGAVSYSGTTATFNPTADLGYNTVYTATLTTAATDLAGNALTTNKVWSFTTLQETTPPTVLATSPIDLATSVAIGTNVSATFSEAMAAATINGTSFTLKQGATAIPGAVSYASGVALFNPTSDLAYNTVYTATVTTAATDLAGNALATSEIWTFTTAQETTPPTVIVTSPLDLATGVAIGANLGATFSEAMAPATIDATTFTLKQGATSIPGAVSYAGTTASFNPTSDLAYNTVYTATIGTGATDLAGNALATDKVWTFTTAQETTPPTVIVTSPADLATSVAIGTNVSATFSEAMAPATINGTSFTLKQGATTVPGAVSYASGVALFNPSADLAYNTVYTATVTTAATDLAGNGLASSKVWTFTTAQETTLPTVIATSPIDLATSVAIGTNVTATFSEAMNPATITASSFTLKQGATTIPGALSYASGVALFNPASDLAYNTVYTATVTTAVTDLVGNALAANTVWSFTTEIETTPPTVIATSPADLATGVAIGSNVSATFSEAMDGASIGASSFTLKQGASSVPGAVSYASNAALFNPTSDLAYNTVYTATITTTATDLAGNHLAANKVWTFTTAQETTPPTVVSTSPVDLATGVAIGSNVSATFSETMAAGTIGASSFTLKQGASSVPGAVSYAGTVATFNPTSDLAYNTVYTATVTTAATDLAGNPLASNKVWTFTTAQETTPPTVIATSPIDLATSVAIGTNVSATFSEAMAAATITASSFTLKQGASSVPGAVSYASGVALFNPTSDLAYNTVYTATVTTAATDLAGNALAASEIWTFTTAQETTPPTVIATSPVDFATGVAIGSNVTATFSEAMNAGTINATNFTLKQGATAVAGAVSYAAGIATFNPSADLAFGTVYTATVSTGATDLAGNALAASEIWSFTTAQETTPPTVIATSPVDLATSVAIGANVNATFSEAMSAGTISASSFTLKQGATTVTGVVSYASNVALFNPSSNLAYNTVYTATITTAATDLAGNPLAASKVWTFTTAQETTPPTVIATSPIDLATSVAIGVNVTATFSEAMAPASITATSFTLKQGATSIPGSLSYASNVALFNPSVDLAYGTVYTATVTTAATDLAGNPLAADEVWTFTTAQESVPPTVTSTSPADLATGVAIATNVSATFSEAMAAATINGTSFTLKQGATAVAGAVSYAGSVATFNPTADLAYGTVYTATVSTAATDLVGNPLAASKVWTFTTAQETTPPTVTATSPADLATDVAIGANLTATFSEAMAVGSINTTSFSLKQGATAIPGSVSYASNVAMFNPTADLAYNTVYTATVSTVATDLAGNPLAADKVWTFTTAAETTPPTVTATSPIDLAVDVAIGTNVSATFSEAMAAATINASTFTLKQGATAVAGAVTYVGGLALFNPSADLAYSTVYTATLSTGATDLAGNPLAANEVWTFTTEAAPAAGPALVSLGSAGDFVILAKSAITATTISTVSGDVGVSPAAASTITGFALTADASNTFSTSDQVAGRVYAADYAAPTPAMLTTAVSNMEAAYTDAAGRLNPDFTEFGAGVLGGQILVPGLYKWSTALSIASSITLNGGPNDVWIFQVAGALTQTAGMSVNLTGGAQAKNVFWQVAGAVSIGTSAHFEGIVLGMTAISLGSGTSFEGRLLAQTAVTIDNNIVTEAAP